MPPVLILGCGYVGTRVAERLLERGERVIATSREPAALGVLARLGAEIVGLEARDGGALAVLREATLEPGLRVLLSIPPATGASGPGEAAAVLSACGCPPSRVVYLSSTSVYGRAGLVDERTVPAPADAHGEARLRAEGEAATGPWPTLVLRAAAIYGPGRGLHVAMRTGAQPRVDDVDRVVSRVHVDDLASLCLAALASDLAGAFPVADEEPASTREVARFCEGLGLPRLRGVSGPVAPRGWPGRRVDGRAVFARLGVTLRHPSFRSGVPDALAAGAA